MNKRSAYFLLGCVIGVFLDCAVLIVRVIALGKPIHWGVVWSPALATCTCLGAAVVGIAERRGKVKSIDTLHGPITLFPPEVPNS